MRLMRIAAGAFLSVHFFGMGPAPEPSSAQPFTGIARGIDGDSVSVGGREVRLFGIDAPEWGQVCSRAGQPWDCGAAAARQLDQLVTGKPVRCVVIATDDFGRQVAQCTVDGIDVNRTMVAAGYAVAYRRYSTAYVSAEESAKVNRRGLWSGSFEVPSQFRREQGTRHSSSLRKTRDQVSVRRVQAGPTGGCNIKGNRGSHGRIYHVPGMPYHAQTVAEQMFCSEAEAQTAGYRRARAR